MEARAAIRAEVLSHLELLASPELQARYERDVEIADVPAELVCVWFDDLDLQPVLQPAGACPASIIPGCLGVSKMEQSTHTRVAADGACAPPLNA